MSLINDVLRQTRPQPYIKEAASVLPVHLLQGGSPRRKYSHIITLISGIILFLYLVQLIIGRDFLTKTESIDVIDESNFASEIVDAANEQKYLAVSENLVDVKDKLIEEAVEVKAEVKSELKPEIQNIADRPKVLSPENRKVIVVEKKADQNEISYQVALTQFRNGHVDEADRIVKSILAKTSSEKYLALQARIFIEKDDSSAFYKLVKQHPENNSMEWYKLIAPGLQLFSYYQLSNQYYQELIKVEPDQIRWQLAVALNYLRLEENNKAMAIYQSLYQSDQVSSRQKQWLMNKIKRLSLNKA